MEPQAANQNSEVPPPEQIMNQGKSEDNHWISILALAIFIILALGAIVFLYSQNQQFKSMIAASQPTAQPTASPAPVKTPDVNEPLISSPSANAKIKSPLKVMGTVPTGWMFEGVFPIKLFDSTKKVIAQGQAKEVTLGSWQSGKPVNFTATLTFKPATGSGTLVLENDNPSGDPAKSKTFEVPINF